MFLTPLELTQASLPEILPDEVVLCIQDNVGLYEGKFKLPSQQTGKVYLTSHRVCYVDSADPKKNSLAFQLKEVDRYDNSPRFFRSSPKVVLYPKPSRNRSSLHSNAITSPSRSAATSPISGSDSPYIPPIEAPIVSNSTWVCTICSFSNSAPRGFDPNTATIRTPLDPCKACGIKPTLAHVLKAAVSNATGRQSVSNSFSSPPPVRSSSVHVSAPSMGSTGSTALASPTTMGVGGVGAVGDGGGPVNGTGLGESSGAEFHCPRCTFSNHPSLVSCEMCGAPLVSENLPAGLAAANARTDSPGPMLPSGAPHSTNIFLTREDFREPIKISFRGGGEKAFFERLRSALTQRKWISSGSAPPVTPESTAAIEASAPDGTILCPPMGQATTNTRVKAVGVAGLEKRVGDIRKNNELSISTAFEDLESLMASAKEIIALAENFSRQENTNGGLGSEDTALAAESATQLGIIATKDITGGGGSNSESLYLSELSRNIAEYLLDDSRGVLRKNGGILTLVDLWAIFNRARGGVELVSPNDFEKAAALWEKLRLPVRLRRFKSGVLVVQGRDRTDEATVRAIQAWMRELHDVAPEREYFVRWDWREFGRGVTAQEVGEKFGWSIGVAEEELEMAEEKGVLCREAGIEGVKYWENFIDTGEFRTMHRERERKRAKAQEDQVLSALRETGLI